MGTIKEECEAVVDNFLDDIISYLTDYPLQRKECADNLKNAFNDLIDTVINEMEEER